MIPVTEDTTLYAVWVSPLRVRYETGLPADDPDLFFLGGRSRGVYL